MSLAVIHEPESWTGAVSGLAGAFSGAAEGEQRNEQKRQFNETNQLDKNKLSEQQLEWDADMEFRYKNLKQMADENKLTRDQSERFKQLDIMRAREEQKSGQDFQVMYAQQVQQPFETVQNALNRKTTERGQTLDYNASTYATTRGFQANMTTLADRRNELRNRLGTGVQVASDVLGPNRWEAMTPEQQAAAVQQGVELDLGVSRVHGGEGIIKATPEEQAASAARVRDAMENFDARKAEYHGELSGISAAESAVRNGQQVDAVGTAPLKFTSTPDTTWSAAFPTSPPRDRSSMSPNDASLNDEIVAEVIPAIYGQAMTGDEHFRQSQQKVWQSMLYAKVSQMDNQSAAIRGYYDNLLLSKLYPDHGAASASIDNE